MKTVFVRLMESPVDEKACALLAAVRMLASGGESANIFAVEPMSFAAIPSSPFAYWVGSGIRAVFQKMPRFESGERMVRQGLATADDFRFVRAAWEVDSQRLGTRWFGLAKGGAYSPYYADIVACVNWKDDGYELKAWAGSLYNQSHWSRILKNTHLYLTPGLTWPLRGVHLSVQAVPSNCVFSVAGKMAFAPVGQLASYLAIFNSKPFDFLVNTRAGKVGGVQYEVGLIAETPVPELSFDGAADLSVRARRAWSLKRSLGTTNETSHAFVLPLVFSRIDGGAVEREMELIQKQIDDEAFRLYGIGAGDRATIEASTKPTTSASDDVENEVTDDADDETIVGGDAEALGSWLVGVAFARFDLRLATGERAIPHEPEPFDPLPARSPGMYPEGEEPGDCPDILVDDEGHSDDLTARAIAVAERVRADVPENLRAWFAKEFFPLHIKMYSRSRRKAPVYWQLATPSASYSVWLYLHASSKDTLFRVQNDYVAPKVAHEERRLESLTSELREGATAGQRKQLAAQAAVIEELRVFLNEVKRVAPLWKPNLDDGVVINFAPLWRLVPQNKSWQKELKSAWEALCEGKYDWAHLAMHLWPERVVPKCAKDRSLAIAHGLEDVFWVEGTDGKRTARKTPTCSIDELVRDRTSPAVKASLKSLLEAPVAQGGGGRGRGGRSRTTPSVDDGGSR